MGVIGRNGGVDLREFEQFKKNLQKTDDELHAFIESSAKELASRLLAKTIKRTPVGDYSKEIEVVAQKDGKKYKKGEVYKKKVNTSGLMGGTLRRGWTANEIRVLHFGNTYAVVITNNVEYASYVEFGHRTRGGKGWVKGVFMLTLSEKELERDAAKILEQRIKKWLEGNLDGK